jgi:hypothetical protein
MFKAGKKVILRLICFLKLTHDIKVTHGLKNYQILHFVAMTDWCPFHYAFFGCIILLM